MKKEPGFLKGEPCNRDGCDGIIEQHREGGCSCHINPPCGYCTDDSQYCPKCNWENSTIEPAPSNITPTEYKPPVIVDDGCLYEIRRYFDDFFEAIVEKNLTYPKAVERRNYHNSKPRYYVYYSIHKQTKMPLAA